MVGFHPIASGPHPAEDAVGTWTRRRVRAVPREAVGVRSVRKEGTLQPAGSTQKYDDAVRKQKSTKTRAERKAETAEARKKGELVPAGEGSPKPSK